MTIEQVTTSMKMKKKQISKSTILTILIALLLLFFTGASPRVYRYGKSLYEKIQLFSEIIITIKEEYVEEKDPQELIESAIKGMVSDLDPHTSYLSSEDFERWNQSYEGYSGIGVTFDIIRDKITIMSVMADGPSDKIGLRAGDRIVAIEGNSAIGMKRDEVPLKLMGPKGTRVQVTVERPGWQKTEDYVITRDEVHVQSVPYAFMLEPETGYIGIIRFSSTTAQELEDQLQSLESQGIERLVLDLRGNGGGRLDAAVDVCDKFLPKDRRIVYTKGRIRKSFREYFSTERATHTLYPLIVLIDRASASASEIVAGAMQDWDRGLVVGETSFGKGLVQKQYPLKDGSALFMTTARYYTPSGRLIQRSYDDKSLQEYYDEITNDSLYKKQEVDDSRPSYKTLILERKVYGGGGISPDISLTSSRDPLNSIIRKIILEPNRPLFTFSEEYVRTHPELKNELDDFILNYNPDDHTLAQFFDYIRDQGFQITEQEFQKNKPDIQFMLKQNIAAEIWGNQTRYRVQLLRDHELQEALTYFTDAQGLLQKAYHVK
jgi:carboxyl-terminal processing protease